MYCKFYIIVTLLLKSIIGKGGPLSIRSLPRTLSQTFLSQLKAVLFDRVGGAF